MSSAWMQASATTNLLTSPTSLSPENHTRQQYNRYENSYQQKTCIYIYLVHVSTRNEEEESDAGVLLAE